jgi:hypothetical protein
MRRIDPSDKIKPEPSQWLEQLRVSLRDACFVAIACTVLALAVNTLRPDGIALIQRAEYQILVPCPVTEGQVEPISAETLKPDDPRTLVIDARASSEYKQWRVSGAMNVPFDYLEPTDPKIIAQIASSGAKRVVVYGDGDDPDSGEQLAKELAGKGIRNVGYVVGGSSRLNPIASDRGAP